MSEKWKYFIVNAEPKYYEIRTVPTKERHHYELIATCGNENDTKHIVRLHNTMAVEITDKFDNPADLCDALSDTIENIQESEITALEAKIARLQEENAELRSMRRFGKVVSVVKCQQCGAWEDGAHWRGMCRNCYVEGLKDVAEDILSSTVVGYCVAAESKKFHCVSDELFKQLRDALKPDKEAADES